MASSNLYPLFAKQAGGGNQLPAVDTRLVAYWKFEDAADPLEDSSVSGEDNVLTANHGGTVVYTAGHFGGRGFTPTDGAVGENFNAGASADWNLSNTSFTIIFSAKVSSALTGSSIAKVIDQPTGIGASWYIGYIQSSSSFRWSSDLNFTSDAMTPDRDTWYRVAFVFDLAAGRKTVYVGGVEANTSTSALPGRVDDDTTTIYIGGQSQDNQPTKFRGSIDQVKFYRSALTALEILAEYDEEVAGGSGGAAPAPTPDLDLSSGIAADPEIGLFLTPTISAKNFGGLTVDFDLGLTRTDNQLCTRIGTEPYHIETFNQGTIADMNYGACSMYTEVVVQAGEKKYVEFTTSDDISSNVGSLLTNRPVFGFYIVGQENPGIYPGEVGSGRGFTNLAKYISGTVWITAILDIQKDDIVSLAIDYNQALYSTVVATVYINGFEITTLALPGLFDGESIRPALSFHHDDVGSTAKILTHQGVQTYAPPAGFTPLEV